MKLSSLSWVPTHHASKGKGKGKGSASPSRTNAAHHHRPSSADDAPLLPPSPRRLFLHPSPVQHSQDHPASPPCSQVFDRHAAAPSSPSTSSSPSSSARSSSSEDDPHRPPPPSQLLFVPLAAAAEESKLGQPLLPPRAPFWALAAGRSPSSTSSSSTSAADSAYGSMDDIRYLPPSSSASSSSSRSSSTCYSSPPSDSGFGSSNAPSPVQSAVNLRDPRFLTTCSRARTRTGIIHHSRSKSVGHAASRRFKDAADEVEPEDERETKRRRSSVRTIDLSAPEPALWRSEEEERRWRDEDEDAIYALEGQARLRRRHTSPGLSRRPSASPHQLHVTLAQPAFVPSRTSPVPRSLLPWRSPHSSITLTLPPTTRSLLYISLALTALTFTPPSLTRLTSPPHPGSALRHVPWPPTPSAPVYLLAPRYGAWFPEWANAFVWAPLLLLHPSATATSTSAENSEATVVIGAVIALARWTLLATAEESLTQPSIRRRRSTEPDLGGRRWIALLAMLWVATVIIRLGLGYVLGRLTGWQWPGLFFGGAVHEWSFGLAPLLWALLPVQAVSTLGESRPSQTASSPLLTASPSSLRRHRRRTSNARAHHRHHRSNPAVPKLGLPSLARRRTVAPVIANLLLTFLSPHAELWWSLAGLIAGSLVAACFRAPSRSSWLMRARTIGARLVISTVALAVVSALRDARVGSGPRSVDPSAAQSDAALYALHPTQNKVLTVLLMTAPRPGHPDFLIRTLATYLSSFPDPSLNPLAGSRLSLVVYTHFADHPVFEEARDVVFADDPKARHYVTWVQRVPGGDKRDRLDQRLHLARALGMVSSSERAEDVPAYVLLAEDDFPLCPDQALSVSSYAGSPLALLPGRASLNEESIETERRLSYAASWSTLSRLILAANVRMPDLPTDHRPASGHCGVFVGTGGSGLIMRGWLAGRLPGLLLGDDDADGGRREQQDLTPEQVASEAPPTDVLIQDCLLGKLPGCEACAAPGEVSTPATTPFSAGMDLVDAEPFKRSAMMTALRKVYLNLATPPRFGFGGRGHSTARTAGVAPGDRWGKSGLVTSERLLMRHLGYNASTIPGRSYKREEWDCGWRHPFNGDPSVLTL